MLGAELDVPALRFSYDTGGGVKPLPVELEAAVLSDEHADEFHDGRLGVLGFTGAMLRRWAQDLDVAGVHADFAYATAGPSRTAPHDDHRPGARPPLLYGARARPGDPAALSAPVGTEGRSRGAMVCLTREGAGRSGPSTAL
ncbi:hypothetical protein [Streptomyces sp. NRRL S-475]|uniref:beta-xylosidase family glycoside hydrolase n=1 Tax=Streptomyces sp. NRRL S-475 TaxID=1463910 RepID=UPI0004C5949C